MTNIIRALVLVTGTMLLVAGFTVAAIGQPDRLTETKGIIEQADRIAHWHGSKRAHQHGARMYYGQMASKEARMQFAEDKIIEMGAVAEIGSRQYKIPTIKEVLEDPQVRQLIEQDDRWKTAFVTQHATLWKLLTPP